MRWRLPCALAGAALMVAIASCSQNPVSEPLPAVSSADEQPTPSAQPPVATQPATPQPPQPPPPPPPPPCQPAQAVAALPIGIRLRQLLFAGVVTDGPAPIATATSAAAAGVGGINFLGNTPQVYADGQLGQVSAAGGAIPPFLAVDQEGGRVQRLKALVGDRPSARRMGATLSAGEVRKIGEQAAADMTRLGLTMDFAPVADVSSQPAGAVIGDRAFSADPDAVALLAGGYAEGLRSGGIIPVLKHFPGIGSATGHTDFEPAVTPPLAQLQAVDLVPYRSLLNQHPVAVMMGTAAVPDLTAGTPAALSPAAVDLLRTAFGFDGVVITDSLSGGAVEARHSLAEAAELALNAGVDMVLWDTTSEIDALVAHLSEAVASARLPESRVNQSVLRVLALKGIDPCALPH